MALEQTAFVIRDNDEDLNSSPRLAKNRVWARPLGSAFRVRFSVEGGGTLGGTLEGSTDGTSWFSVSDTSGTAQATHTPAYEDGDATTAVLTSSTNFVAGSADEEDGAVAAVVLSGSQHTEVEYAVQLLDVSSGSVYLRLSGLGTYTRTAEVPLSLSDLDRVRLRVGDTDMSDPLLSDQEIETLLGEWPGNLDLVAANAAEAIAAKFSRGFNFTTERQQFNRSERVNHYTQLAANLRRRGGALVTT